MLEVFLMSQVKMNTIFSKMEHTKLAEKVLYVWSVC